MDIRKKIEILIQKSLKELNIEVSDFVIEHPSEISHGDYSTNIALIIAKKLNQSPREIAEKIVEKLNQKKTKEIERIEVAGAGFINFFLSSDFFVSQTSAILKLKKNWGDNKNLKKQKIIIEYTQPNPFKEFHVGHLVNNIVGESVSRLINAEGARVKRVTYHGDVGLHVAKAIWGMQKNTLNPGVVADWGRAYALGDVAYTQDENSKKEITEINKKVYEKSDDEINKLYEDGRELSLRHFEKIYTRLGRVFQTHFFESQAGIIGKKLVEKFLKRGIFEKSDGAIIFPDHKSGLHTRVFINSEGLPTYEAKDLGLVKLKKNFYNFEKSITVTDIEQAEYYKVVTSAIEYVFPKLKRKVLHLSHGRLRLPEGRMSSRGGNIISGESLLDSLKALVITKMEGRDIENKDKVADQVAVAALKYSILKQSLGRNIIFDFEKSLSFEGDSGPHLQYSAVRAKSILEKAKQEKISSSKKPGANYKTGGLERLLYRFPEVVEKAGKEREFAPHTLVSYLIELSSVFNTFYAKEKIVDQSNPDSGYKISLTECFLITMEKGLDLLGIETPEKM